MYKKFPGVPKRDIIKILQYGWKQVYLLNSYGGDVVMTSNDGFWVYFGKMTNDSIKHYNYYKYKLALKIRVLFKRKNL